MGQRLNIEIVNKGALLANCYYHWSAYTASALYLTKTIIDKFDETSMLGSVKDAVELLESTGGGINDSERALMAKQPNRFANIDFKPATSRTDGLISVTEAGMNKTRDWEEGRVTIDISEQTFDFCVISEYTKDEYEDEYCGDECSPPAENLPELPWNLSCIPFADIDALINFVETNQYGARDTDEDTVVVWIE